MSSISTKIPTGPIRDFEWCYASLYDMFSDDYTNPDFNTCANATRGTRDSDFQTFCCDGDIIGFYASGLQVLDDFAFEDLTCCRISEPQMGGIGPIPENNGKTCTGTASPTPLASLAATNTANAQPYLVTYKSAKQVGTTVTDWVRRETPTCFWVDTAHGVSMTSVQVGEAQVTTLPPDSTDRFGDLIESSTLEASESEVSTTRGGSETETEGGASETSRLEGASTALNAPAALCLGLLLVPWFVSVC